MFYDLKKIRLHHIVLFLTLFVGIFIRFYHLDKIPPSLSRDEVSVGYNAYSILKTGKDEYGRVFPLVFEAFGDWKLPLNIYLDLPFIALFGLNEMGVRFPVALAGSLSLVIIYFLSEEIRKRFTKLNRWFSVLTTFLLAVSPWHIYMSRTGFGHNVIALLLFLTGLYFSFRSFKSSKNLIWATLFYIATLFLYTSYHIFLPLFLFTLFLLFRKELIKQKYFRSCLVLFGLFFVFSQIILWEANKTKIPGSSITSDGRMIYYQIERKQNEHQTNQTIARIFHNKILVIPQRIVINFLNAFSPQFLFEKGGENPINNLEEMGNFYLVDAFFIVLGLFFLIRKWNRGSVLILSWVLLSALPGSFTKDAPHSTRTFALVVSSAILGSFGLMHFYALIRRSRKVIFAIIFVAYLISFLLFLEFYYYHFPLNRARFWGYGYKQMVETVNRVKPQKTIVAGLYDSPYIFFLFYNSYSPNNYHKEAQRAATTWDGFKPVTDFSGFSFVDRFDWNHVWDQKETLYIDFADNIPKDYPVRGWINYPFGDKAFGYFLTRGDPCRFGYPEKELIPQVCR